MLTAQKLEDIVAGIDHAVYDYVLRWDDERPYLQIKCCEGTCNVTGKPMSWSSRKWMLSLHMTEGEVVQTAFLATRVASEHEDREQFTYCGETVFDPHLDMEQLVRVRRDGTLPIKEREHHG